MRRMIRLYNSQIVSIKLFAKEILLGMSHTSSAVPTELASFDCGRGQANILFSKIFPSAVDPLSLLFCWRQGVLHRDTVASS